MAVGLAIIGVFALGAGLIMALVDRDGNGATANGSVSLMAITEIALGFVLSATAILIAVGA